MQLKSTCGRCAMLSRFTINCGKYYVPNWFNCLIVCPFGQSAKYYSKKRGKLIQLCKEVGTYISCTNRSVVERLK